MTDSATSVTGSKVAVTATPSIVVWRLLQEIGKYIPKASAVYQANLDYADGLRSLRAESQRKKLFDKTALPLLLFNRGTVKGNEVLGKRSRLEALGVRTTADGATLNPELYKVLMGELEFRFLYVTSSMEELERFEMMYMTGTEVQNIKSVTVDLPGIGELTYKIEWEPLEDFQLTVDDGYYKSIGSTAKIKGPFVVSLGKQLALIQDIFAAGAVRLHVEGDAAELERRLEAASRYGQP